MTTNVELTGQFRIDGLTPANTNEATMFTAANERPTIVEFWVANLTAAPANATIKWSDGSNDYSIIDTFCVPARGYLVEREVMLPLRSGYLIKVTSGTANALTFTLISVAAANVGRPPA